LNTFEFPAPVVAKCYIASCYTEISYLIHCHHNSSHTTTVRVPLLMAEEGELFRSLCFDSNFKAV